jgi:hypothetical protein
MSLVLQTMTEQLDMSMLCMSRRLASLSGDPEILETAAACFKAADRQAPAPKQLPPPTPQSLSTSAPTLDEPNAPAGGAVVAATRRPPIAYADVAQSSRADWHDLRRSWNSIAAETEGKHVVVSAAGALIVNRNIVDDAEASSGAPRLLRTSISGAADGPQQIESAAVTSVAASTDEQLEGVRRSMRLPQSSWLEAVASALRGDVEGTLVALKGRSPEEVQALADAEQSERRRHAGAVQQLQRDAEAADAAAVSSIASTSMAAAAAARVRAPRLDLTLQPVGRLSPELENSLDARRASARMPAMPSPPISAFPLQSTRLLPRPELPDPSRAPSQAAAAQKSVPPPPNSATLALLAGTTMATSGEARPTAVAFPETAAFLASGPSFSIPPDLSTEVTTAASASAAARDAGGARNVGTAVGPLPAAASAFIPLTAFIPPVVRPRAVYGADGRITLAAAADGGALDPYQSIAARAAAEGRPLFPAGPGNHSALLDFSAVQAQASDAASRLRAAAFAAGVPNALQPEVPIPQPHQQQTLQELQQHFAATDVFASALGTAAPRPVLPTYVNPPGGMPQPPVSPPLGFFGFAGQAPATPQQLAQLQQHFHRQLLAPPTMAQTALSSTMQQAWPTLGLPPGVPVGAFVSGGVGALPGRSALSSPARAAAVSAAAVAAAATSAPRAAAESAEPPFPSSALSAEVERLLEQHKALENRSLHALSGKPLSLSVDHQRHQSSLPRAQYSSPTTLPRQGGGGGGGAALNPTTNAPQPTSNDLPAPTAQTFEAQAAVQRAQQALLAARSAVSAAAGWSHMPAVEDGIDETSRYVDLSNGGAW